MRRDPYLCRPSDMRRWCACRRAFEHKDGKCGRCYRNAMRGKPVRTGDVVLDAVNSLRSFNGDHHASKKEHATYAPKTKRERHQHNAPLQPKFWEQLEAR